MSSCSDSLQLVLTAAAKAKGNHARFLHAGLIDSTGTLSENWQANFARLKPLRKAELRSQPGAFLVDASDIVYRGQTSGTQGDAFTYFAGKAWNQARVSARQRSLSWWGIDAQTPMLNLASKLSPVRRQDSSLVGEIDDEFLDILISNLQARSLILRGYPSRLCEVAIALQHRFNSQDGSILNACQGQPVVAVIATGECLYEQQRALLEQTFDAPVINEYGSQECGISGLSCPEAGRLHLDRDRCLYEMVDGELLTTDLHNCVMPMVRYSGGDAMSLSTEHCPCGRPGPTAMLLGRQEEVWTIRGEKRWPGSFELPRFPNISSYQIQLSETARRVWVQPSLPPGLFSSQEAQRSAALTPLKAWLDQTFGEQTTEILIESAPDTSAARKLTTVSSQTWLKQVTDQAWSSWLNNPLPLGVAEQTAELLHDLVIPRQIMGQGLYPRTTALIAKLMLSNETQDFKVEVMKLRVLLWATGLQAGAAQQDHSISQQYEALLERFQQWVERDRATALSHASALGFDLLAPLLTLDGAIAHRLWDPVQKLLQKCWPEGIRADRFTLHHYLAILDQAGWKTQRHSHPWLPALRPLPAMLQGDLIQFAAQLNPSMVSLWAEIIHNRPGTFYQSPTNPLDSPTFQSAWQQYRQALLRQDSTAMASHLSQCFDQAHSPAQTARCWLEKAYGQLVLQESLEPKEWLDVLRQQVGLGQPNSTPVTNPLPWLPLLKVLAPQLLEAEEPELAYACLFAAAPPNRHQSMFDRQTQTANGKQSVLSWRAEL